MSCVLSCQPAICKPHLAQVFHLAAAFLGAFVILLQRIDSRKERLQIGTIEPGKSREQALFFIGGVLGRRFSNITQARGQSDG